MMVVLCQTMLWAQTTIQVTPAGVHCQGDTVILTAPECQSGQILLEERFESITSGNDTTTNGQNSQITSMYSFPIMEKVYKAGGKVKLGTGSAVGSMTSRSLDLSGPFRVVIRAKKWVNTTKDTELRVTVDGGETQQRTVNTLDYADYVFVFQASTAASPITIATADNVSNRDKRVFIDSVVVESVGGGECTYLWSAGNQTTQSIEVVLQNDTVITLQQSDGNATSSATFSWQNPVVVDVFPNPVPPVCAGTEVMLTAHADNEDSVVVFNEGFSAITLGNDNSGAGSSKKYGKDFPVLPSFPECDTGHVFVAGGALRFGDVSSGDGGYITSAPMNLSRPFIVKLWVRGWNNTNDNPCFFLMVDQDTVYRDTIGPMGWADPYVELIYQSNMPATSTSTITIGNDTIRQRFFLDSVAVIILDTMQYVWDVPYIGSSVTVAPDETTTYTVTATNGVGCSGTESFEVTIKHPVTFDTTATACDSFTWRGVTYTESPAETPSDTIVGGASNGCDSIVTLHLTINHATNLSFAKDTCDRYTWRGKIYTESGDYKDTLTDGNGCTQVDTLHLTIYRATNLSFSKDTCDRYTWRGKTYTESGDYKDTLTDGNGCTQVDTLHLTIYRATNLSFSKDTCDRYTWRGKTYTESGDYKDTLTDGNGCIQVDTLHLAINHAVTELVEATACDSFVWHGRTFYESTDTATFRTSNAAGCDSIVTLHLTVEPSLEVSMVYESDTICAGDSVSLRAVTNIPPNYIHYELPVSVGDILCTDNTIVKPADWPVSGKQAMGIVFYVDNTGLHGWAVHLQEQQSNLKWSLASDDLPNLPSYSTARAAIADFDGYNNTQIIRSSGTSADFPAAYAVDFTNGWYLPAAGQLNILFGELYTINPSLQMVGGAQIPVSTLWSYHSSSENGQYEWSLQSAGNVVIIYKRYTYNPSIKLRSIRTF